MVSGNIIASVNAADELPLVDLSNETNRHVVVAAGTKEVYQGHPTTVLSDDGKRLFCVWTLNHGGKCGPAAESLDGGRTWKRVDGRLPAVYAETHMNCPTLQKLMTPEGRERWLIFSRKGEWDRGGRLGVMASDDCGLTWRESGVFNLPAAMPPTGFIQLKDGSYALFGQERKNPSLIAHGELLGDVALRLMLQRIAYPEHPPCELYLDIPGEVKSSLRQMKGQIK